MPYFVQLRIAVILLLINNYKDVDCKPELRRWIEVRQYNHELA